jgi:hypothetical protein
MKHRNFRPALAICVATITSSWLSAPTWAAPLDADDMYLDPASIPTDYYDYDYFDSDHTAFFSNVTSLQVLPPLLPDGSDYYFRPTVDYTGDITGTDGSITFLRPGPYFVLATYTDATSTLFDFGVQFICRDPGDHESDRWVKQPTPSPDIVITDPNEFANPNPPPDKLTLPPTDPDFPDGTTVIHNLQTWTQVRDYLRSLPPGSNKHVELGGHGNVGKFFWNGQSIPASDFEELRGKVNNLTFMSCKTGAGDGSYLAQIAGYLGRAGGYTDVVAGNGSEWFIREGGTFKDVPLPGTLVLLAGGIAMVRRRRAA